MKTIFLFIAAVFLTGSLYSQENGIRLTNIKTNETRFIEEYKRVRIKLQDKKASGRFKILDDKTILIKDEPIQLENIEKIKKNPLAMNIAVDFVLGTIGAYFVIIGLAVGISLGLFFNNAAFGFLVGGAIAAPGALFIYGAIKSPNLLRSYKKSRSWEYSLVGF